MAIPMQPPSMTGISSAGADAGSTGADAISIGGLNWSPKEKSINDVAMMAIVVLGVIGVGAVIMRGRG